MTYFVRYTHGQMPFVWHAIDNFIYPLFLKYQPLFWVSITHTHFMCENFMMLEHSLVDHPYYILCIRQFLQRFDKTIRVRLFNFIENVTIKFKTIGLCPLFSDFHGLIFLCFVCVFCCCCNLIDIPSLWAKRHETKWEIKNARTHTNTHMCWSFYKIECFYILISSA